MHEIEYNKFELIFIYHSLYNLQDVSRKQKADETDGRGEKTGTEEAILCIYYMTRMEIHACNACGSEEKCKDENLALLTYMLQHNEHHAAELDEMADKLEKAGMADAAKQIREGVSDFQKVNMRLSLALTLVKEHLKEVK